MGLPVKFSETAGGVAATAAVYGQHTREVLAVHGYPAAEIDAPASSGAIAAAG